MSHDLFLSILACPVCNESLIKDRNLLTCSSCEKSYFQNDNVIDFIEPKLSADVLFSKQKWEEIYRSKKVYKSDYKIDPTILSYKSFLDKYKREIKRGIFLDLGCGVAWISALLAKNGVRVIGLDISRKAIIRSRALFKREKLDGSFLKADLLSLPFKDNVIKFIYSCMSLEYVRDTQAAINEAYRVLKVNGTMVAILPTISLITLTYHQLRGDIPNIPIIKQIFEFMHIKIFKGRYMQYGYEQSFSPELLKKMFLNAKFKINKIDYFDIHYPIPFIPKIIRVYFQKILRYRLFWPLMYIEVSKIKQ